MNTAIRFLCVPVLLSVVGADLSAAQAGENRRLLEIVPDDAGIVCLIERPGVAFHSNMLEALSGSGDAAELKKMRAILDAVRHAPGPILVGYIHPSRPGKRPVVFVALRPAGPASTFDAWMDKHLLPAMRILFPVGPGGRVVVDRRRMATRIVAQPGDQTLFAFATRGGLVFGANKPQLALQWKRGDWPKKRWVAVPGVRRLLKRLPAESSVRFLVNPRPWLKLLPEPKPNSTDELAMKVLSPSDVQCAAVDLDWRRASVHLRLSLALADECKGIARVLSRSPSAARTLGVFPDDFVAIGRIGWGSAQAVVDGLYGLTDVFDETISAEYREDLAAFGAKTGVAWDTAVLGNLVHELSFGIRVDFTRSPPVGWAAVAPLRDASAFTQQLDRLITHFGLTFEDASIDGLAIRKAVGTTPFSLATSAGLLILADTPEAVADLAKRAGEKNIRRPTGENLRACYAGLDEPNQLAVMVDLHRLRERFPILPVAVGPVFAPLLMEGSMALSATVEDRVARVDLRWSLVTAGGERRMARQQGLDGAKAMATLTAGLVRSAMAARRQSQRLISMHNMRTLGQAFFIYAERHGGALPDSLADLFRALPNAAPLSMLVSPYDGKGPKAPSEIEEKAYLIYRPGLTTGSDPGAILLAEREVFDGRGANFLFVDGHVEYIAEPRAGELIDRILSGEEEVRK